MARTETAVHSPAQMTAQRRDAARRGAGALNALSVYAQLSVGCSMYLYGAVSTPGYGSVLLVLPAVLVFCLPAWLLARRGYSLSNPGGAKLVFLGFALLHLLDAQIAFFALCALARNVMPDGGGWAFPLAAALFCALGDGEESALSRLARPLGWLMAALMLYCGAAALPYGHISHFFPLLGWGPGSILSGGLWMAGAAASCVWPLLTCEEASPSPGFFPAVRPALMAIVLAAATYAVSVWLLPVYGLTRPESLGWRLLLIVHMTPSIPAWSMEVAALLLLMLTAVCYSASQAARALGLFGGRKAAPRFFNAGLLFLLTPACAVDPEGAEKALAAAAPWRTPALLALLLLLGVHSLRRKRKIPLPEETP